jgi:hypothetical protein
MRSLRLVQRAGFVEITRQDATADPASDRVFEFAGECWPAHSPSEKAELPFTHDGVCFVDVD